MLNTENTISCKQVLYLSAVDFDHFCLKYVDLINEPTFYQFVENISTEVIDPMNILLKYSPLESLQL